MLDTIQTTVRIETFRGWLEHGGRSTRSVDSYISDLNQFQKYYETANHIDFSVEVITSLDLRAWRKHSLEVENVKPATWNRRRAMLALLCQFGQESGALNYNPFQGVMYAAKQALPPRWLTEREFGRLTRVIEQQIQGAKTDFRLQAAFRDQAMVALMAYGGLREGELVLLRRDHLLLTERKGRIDIPLGKGDKWRAVPLSVEARRLISGWMLQTGEAVFGGLTTRTVQRRVKELGRLAGIDNLTPHALRHTFAKRLVDNGVQLTVVADLMGHARLETTRRYVQPGWEDFEKAVEVL